MVQQPLFPPTGDWSPPKGFPNLSAAKKIAVDVETCDPHLKEKGPGFFRKDAYVVGISIAADDKSWYFPIQHAGGGNMDRDKVIAWVKSLMSRRDLWVTGANLSYDIEALDSLGITIDGRVIDVQLVEPLIDEEQDSYSLDSLCKRYLGRPKEETLLKEAASAYGVDPKSGLWQLHSRYVGAYAEYDAACCLQILEQQMKTVAKEDLQQVLELECKLQPILFKMRKRGIPIDVEQADSLKRDLTAKEKELRHAFFKTYNCWVDEWSSKLLAALCDARQIHYPRTGAGNPSFESEFMDNSEAPLLKHVAEIREISRFHGAFVDSWIFGNLVNGRIHPRWKQLASDEGGTRTGRMAASNPNPQQIPAEKQRNGKVNEWGIRLRALFSGAVDGVKWGKYDYSQQEPRILTHYASTMGLTGAKPAAMLYRQNPKMDFYQYMMDAANINRRMAKDMYLGRCYGMGKAKMAAKLNRPVEETEQILRNFDVMVPFVKEIADFASHRAQERGFIKTLLGRRRHFNLWEPSYVTKGERTEARTLEAAKAAWPGSALRRAFTHKALNALIQGSAADMMKAAIVKAHEIDGRYPYITVHDELGVPIHDDADAQVWKQVMENAVEMSVPVVVDVSIGDHWK